MVEAIVIVIILINLPSIVGFVIGIIWGLVDIAIEGMGDNTTESFSEENAEKPIASDMQVSVFFKGCTTEDALRSRYRALMKIYHPDGEHGDVEIAKRINSEYEMLVASQAR